MKREIDYALTNRRMMVLSADDYRNILTEALDYYEKPVISIAF